MKDELIEQKAIRAAKRALRNKIVDQKGIVYQQISPTEKLEVDKQVDKEPELIKKLAARLVTKMQLGEVKTAISDARHLKTRRAQEEKRHKRDISNAVQFPRQVQRLPSSKYPKIQTPASKQPRLTIDSVQHNETSLTESYDSMVVAKPTGIGSFMTAKDLGIKIKAGFAHHPSVEEELEARKNDKMD